MTDNNPIGGATEFLSDEMYYVENPAIPFLVPLTLQHPQTAPDLARTLHAQGFQGKDNERGRVGVFNKAGNPVKEKTLLKHIHTDPACADIIKGDPFFENEMEENELRVFRTIGLLRNLSTPAITNS